MTQSITFTANEISQLLTQHLRQQGYEVQGSISLNIHPGSRDPREPSDPSLASVTVTVKHIPAPSGPPANMLNGQY